MVDIKNIVLNTPVETLERLLSPFIEEQFPSFMRRDYRKLVLFIKAYYEWMEQRDNPGFVLSRLDTIYDIDRSLEEFYNHFKVTYLDGFPDILATNTSGNKPNKNTLLKHIRDFYGNKGTENAYKFLFRVLYDSDVEFYYPKEDVLKTSDGRWVENVSIKTTSSNGSVLFNARGTTVYQYIGNALVASADIDSVVQYNQNGYEITEFFLKNLIGNFVSTDPIVLLINGEQYTENLYSVLSEFFIETPGKNFRVGDEVFITDEKGTGFSAFIEQTGLGGTIKKIGVKNSGINYFNTVTVSFISETGDLSSAVVFASPTAITRYPGFYTNNSGKLSSTKKIQDGNYYQDFSYVLKTAVSLDTYFQILKELVHPAGTRMFGSILVKDVLQNEPNTSVQGTVFRNPIVGNYTPYALRTFTNLRNSTFLPNQVVGATLQVWLSTYNINGGISAGLTANWGYILQNGTIGSDPGGRSVTVEDIFGVKDWISLVGGHTFSHVNLYPNSNVWLTPHFKKEAINTHASINFRPVQYNFSGPSQFSSLCSHGFSGPTMGRLGLTASISYFAVVKPNRLTTANNYGAYQTGNVLLADHGAWGGLFFGVTGSGNSLKDPKVFAYVYASASAISGVSGSIGTTGDWKIVSNTHSIGSGNSGPFSLFLNGVCLGTVSQALAKNNSSATATLMIGVAKNDSLNGAFDGELAEIIAYQGDVGEINRQKVEGYLAHKYGLAANLPSTHPYKTTPPGGSYGSGKWYGNTGDFYPSGYNPYIGSTAEVGINGTTAPLGSGFFYTQLGYTYTVCDEFGVTAHNPIGAPLGSTAAWFRGRETNLSPEGMRGLVLWLKPENIGVCGSVANGVSVDVWRDASPSGNDAMPPTWDKWNGVAHITHTATTISGWTRQVYDNTNPVTKIAFVFNGLCGGFTQGRRCKVGLNTASDVTTGNYYPGNWVYSLGPVASDTTAIRRVYYINFDSSGNYEQSSEMSPTMDGFDNSVFEMEYVEPNLIWRKDGVVKRQKNVGYGQTFYMDSAFYLETADSSRTGTSVTITELSYNGNPVNPTFTVSSGMSAVKYAGVTVDKLRPTLQTASASGATGVSFNGGLVFSPQTTYRGVSLAAGICMGFTAAGSSAEKLMTGQHMYLKRPLKITDDADIFVVYRSTLEGLSYGYGLLASRNTNVAYGNNLRLDSVLFNRSYNAEDRNPSLQNSSYYTILPNGTVLYPGSSLPPVGLVGFRPQGDAVGAAQNFIAYDPHLSGVCMGTCIGEARRDSNNKIESFLNGDIATNSSPVTGRRIVSVSAPPTDDFIITKNLAVHFDAGKTNSTSSFTNAYDKNLLSLSSLVLKQTPISVIYPNQVWSTDGPGGSVVDFGGETYGTEVVYKVNLGTGTDRSVYLNNFGGTRWDTSSSGLKSRTWTFSVLVKRSDGAAITSASVAMYTGSSYGQDISIEPATNITPVGSDWYRITRTRVLSDPYVPTLVGLAYFQSGTNEIYISQAQLLPFGDTTDLSGIGGRTLGSYPSGYSINGSISNNSIISSINPWGYEEFVWDTKNHNTPTKTSWANGGFDVVPRFTVDNTKTYRFSIWVNRKVLGTDGRFYLGTYGRNSAGTNVGLIQRISGANDTNPYFAYPTPQSSAFSGKQNQWILVVGHIHPAGSGVGSDHPNSGYYVRSGSGLTYASLRLANNNGMGDFVFRTDTQNVAFRTYLYYCTDNTVVQQTMRPRIDLVDGTEPTIEELLNNQDRTIYDASPNGKNFVATNFPIWSSENRGVLTFSGRRDTLSAANLNVPNPNTMTFEAWINPTSVPSGMFMGFGGLPYFTTDYGNSYFLSLNISGRQVAYSNIASGKILPNSWHHLATTIEPNDGGVLIKSYYNGELVDTRREIGNHVLESGNVFCLGDRFPSSGWFPPHMDGGDYAYNGKISNARVYSRTLTPIEIKQNFNSLRNRFGL